MTVEQIRATFVDPFPGSPDRLQIMAGLATVIARCDRVGLEGELWINGSFTTRKFDPDDADIVLRVRIDGEKDMSPEQRDVVTWLLENQYDALRCDTYSFAQYPEGNPLYWEGEYWYAYWMKQWGFSRRDEMKGIAVYELSGEQFKADKARWFWWMHRSGGVAAQVLNDGSEWGRSWALQD